MGKEESRAAAYSRLWHVLMKLIPRVSNSCCPFPHGGCTPNSWRGCRPLLSDHSFHDSSADAGHPFQTHLSFVLYRPRYFSSASVHSQPNRWTRELCNVHAIFICMHSDGHCTDNEQFDVSRYKSLIGCSFFQHFLYTSCSTSSQVSQFVTTLLCLTSDLISCADFVWFYTFCRLETAPLSLGKETGQVTINDSSQRNFWIVVCAWMRGRDLNHNNYYCRSMVTV